MQFTTAILATLGLAGLATAAPMPQDDGCSLYPWFIVPYTDSQTCSSTPEVYQPTSGPYDANAVNSGCRFLYDPNGQPKSFQSVSINRDACPQQPWTILLYTDAACSTQPIVVQSDSCVASPGTDAASQFQSFQAIRLAN